MQRDVVAAVVQMCSTLDKAENLARAEALVAEAARDGAQLVVLPELFSVYGPLPEVVQQAELIPGPTSERLAAWAARWEIFLCGGSIAEQADMPGKAWNTSLLFNPQGKMIGKYRKLHRFDVTLGPGCNSRESDVMLAGEGVTVSDTPWGKCGQAICYDLRFPELFRALSAAEVDVVLFPSAFTSFTGIDHWEPLIRARAIENQVFLLAANQTGEHGSGRTSWGHSAILDPWGRILADVSSGEGMALAALSAELLTDVRARLPALRHRRR